MEKALTVRPLSSVPPECADALRAAMSQYDTSGGLLTLGEVLSGSTLCEVCEGDRPVMWFAVKSNQHATSNEAEVVAAAGAAPFDLTRSVLPWIESAVSDQADALTIYTRRPGMRRKLERLGYRVDAFVMRKTLRVQS
ncbi:MAG: hypothetical protein DI561_15050 [Thauera sp.]|nr:MAG: hypothetical protein DI561_15050 [Thauera sp.]